MIFFLYMSFVFLEFLAKSQCCVRFFLSFSKNFYFTLDETSFLQGIFIIFPELPTKRKPIFFLSNFIIYKKIVWKISLKENLVLTSPVKACLRLFFSCLIFSFQGKFSYGPLDMAALTSERVDIHIMKGGHPQFFSPNSIYFFQCCGSVTF